ncbi:carboxylic ester hydrolase-like [Bacillus rossius redtenbacheri]|uniref:carboxylic ester hydrolase-like n=1 Tax=Bacillus rossius redtenbacheri TaxID=93214 RepID=UPI002FDE2348
MDSWTFFVLAFIATIKLSASVDGPTVEVAEGTLRGVVDRTADNTTFYKFLKIPYARAPLGSLRFTAPQEHAKWTGERDATKYGHTCLQYPNSGANSEDCLFINVYTPLLPSGKANESLLPVMVHIHGGAFVTGSANAGPGQLMNYGVVMASIAYRLNLFGFTSIQGTDAPGNAGLKDQVAALKWIRKNIRQFVGDPDMVTIMGESAGGASVHYHILSPGSRGLFHRAISESGSALNPFAFGQNTEASAFELSALVGRPAGNRSELVEALRAASASELLEALPNVTVRPGSQRPFAPCLEFPREGEQPFLTRTPWDLVRAGNFVFVPYIAGSTEREAASSAQSSDLFWQGVDENPEEYLVPHDLGLARGSNESIEVAAQVKRFYFGDAAVSNATRDRWVDLETDLKYALGVVTTVHAHARFSTAKTFNYWLTFGAATHAMEWRYVVYGGQVLGVDSRVAGLARSLGQLWTSFAKTGTPEAGGEVAWLPVAPESYPYLEINPPNSLHYDVEKDRMDFWFGIYDKYRHTETN